MCVCVYVCVCVCLCACVCARVIIQLMSPKYRVACCKLNVEISAKKSIPNTRLEKNKCVYQRVRNDRLTSTLIKINNTEIHYYPLWTKSTCFVEFFC